MELSESEDIAASHVIDGKRFAAALRGRVAEGVAKVKVQGLNPGIAVVLIGDDPASQIYVRSKEKMAAEVGIASFHHAMPASATREEILAKLHALNADPAVNGILVQLPLPRHEDEALVIDTVDPAKDVDGFHPINAGLLWSGQDGLVPCTPLGCLMMLKHLHGDLSGKHAVVIGRSNIVGRPMAGLLLKENCTVTVVHSKSRYIKEETRRADILIAAVGKAEMIEASWIKPGATVLDVGINRIDAPDGTHRIVGDVNFIEAVEVAGAITPVPGGVGPMTIACLLYNTLKAACLQRDIAFPLS